MIENKHGKNYSNLSCISPSQSANSQFDDDEDGENDSSDYQQERDKMNARYSWIQHYNHKNNFYR